MLVPEAGAEAPEDRPSSAREAPRSVPDARTAAVRAGAVVREGRAVASVSSALAGTM